MNKLLSIYFYAHYRKWIQSEIILNIWWRLFVLDCELRARGICIYMKDSTLLGTVAITGSIYYSHLCILRLFLFYYNYIIIIISLLLFSYSCMLVHNNETFGLLCFLMCCWEGWATGVGGLVSGSFLFWMLLGWCWLKTPQPPHSVRTHWHKHKVFLTV